MPFLSSFADCFQNQLFKKSYIRFTMGVSNQLNPDQVRHFGCSYKHVRIQRGGDWESGPPGKSRQHRPVSEIH